MSISDYSTTPGSNTSISSISIAEQCPPGNLNDALRQMMADLAVFLASPAFTGTVTTTGDFKANGVITAKTPNSGTTGGLQLQGNPTSGFAYLQVTNEPGSDEWGTFKFDAAGDATWDGAMAFGNASQTLSNLGGVEILGVSLGASGYVKLGFPSIANAVFMLQWGTYTVPAAKTFYTQTLPQTCPTGGLAAFATSSSAGSYAAARSPTATTIDVAGSDASAGVTWLHLGH